MILICLVVLTSIHAKHGSLPADFSCKSIYNLLLQLPTVSPRLAGFWLPAVGTPATVGPLVWHKSRLKLIENKRMIWFGLSYIVLLRSVTLLRCGVITLSQINVLSV